MSRKTLLGFALGAALAAVPAPAGAQRVAPGLGLHVFFDVGVIHSGMEAPRLPDGYRARFQPPGGPMTTTAGWSRGAYHIGVLAEPALSIGRVAIGLPVFYYLPVSDSLHATRLQWWDEVTLQSLSVTRTSPAFGVSLRVDTALGGFAVRGTLQAYEVTLDDHAGRDCVGCRNSSYVIASTVMDRGWGWRLALRYRPDWRHGSFGVFATRDGADLVTAGVNYEIDVVDLPGRPRRNGEQPQLVLALMDFGLACVGTFFLAVLVAALVS